MQLKPTLATIASALVSTMMLSVPPASATEYRMLVSWDQNYPGYKSLILPFVKEVEEATKGGMKFKISGPETVPSFEQLQPTGSGVFHFLFTHGAYHFGTTPVATAIEAIQTDQKTWRAAGIKDFTDKHYQQFGVKLFGLAVSPPNIAYNIILRQPVKPSGDLQGMKIRMSPSYEGVVKMLGASPVVLPPAEVYTGLDKGLVDGAAWPSFGAYNYRWYEVAKHIMKPTFGVGTQLFFMNLATWNKLTDDERKILNAAVEKLEDTYYVEYARMVDEEDKLLMGKGMTISEVGPAQKAKIQGAWEQGLWDMSIKKNAKDTEALRQLAISKGLSK